MSSSLPAIAKMAPANNGIGVKPPQISTVVREGLADTVMVEVGPERKKYFLLKEFLIYYSKHFRELLATKNVKCETRVITLDEVEPGVFDVFVHWLYSQGFPKIDDWADLSSKPSLTDSEIYLAMVKAYEFGEHFGAPGFRRAVNNLLDSSLKKGEIASRLKCESLHPALAWSFKNISGNRPLLQNLVDQYCLCWWFHEDSEADREARKKLPTLAMLRIMAMYSGLQQDVWPPEKSRCYREHASWEEFMECKLWHWYWNSDGDCDYVQKANRSIFWKSWENFQN